MFVAAVCERLTAVKGRRYNIFAEITISWNGVSRPTQLSNGTYLENLPNNEGDLCGILLPPTGHYLKNILATLPNDHANGGFDENFLNIIVAQSAITNTLVDGAMEVVTNFVSIGTNGCDGAQITVMNNGANTLTSSEPVGVEVYCWGDWDAYGYFFGIIK